MNKAGPRFKAWCRFYDSSFNPLPRPLLKRIVGSTRKFTITNEIYYAYHFLIIF